MAPQPGYQQPAPVPQYQAPAPVYQAPAPAYQPGWAAQGCAPSGYQTSGYGAYPAGVDTAYTLDSGDRLRITVFGQEGLTNTYAIDAGGAITLPLTGPVPARGRTPAGLAAEIAAKLRGGFIRDPSVAVEIED